MSMKVNFSTWQIMLGENIQYLQTLPRTLERDHIILILEALKQDREFYDKQPHPYPND